MDIFTVMQLKNMTYHYKQGCPSIIALSKDMKSSMQIERGTINVIVKCCSLMPLCLKINSINIRTK